jgi:hypothetical protein
MKLFTTITSERGKPVTKSGNEHITIDLQDEKRDKIASIVITNCKIVVSHYLEKTTVQTIEYPEE